MCHAITAQYHGRQPSKDVAALPAAKGPAQAGIPSAYATACAQLLQHSVALPNDRSSRQPARRFLSSADRLRPTVKATGRVGDYRERCPATIGAALYSRSHEPASRARKSTIEDLPSAPPVNEYSVVRIPRLTDLEHARHRVRASKAGRLVERVAHEHEGHIDVRVPLRPRPRAVGRPGKRVGNRLRMGQRIDADDRSVIVLASAACTDSPIKLPVDRGQLAHCTFSRREAVDRADTAKGRRDLEDRAIAVAPALL